VKKTRLGRLVFNLSDLFIMLGSVMILLSGLVDMFKNKNK